MYLATAFRARPAFVRFAAILLVACIFAGCKKDETAAAPDAATRAAAEQAPAAAAMAEKVNAMSVEQLRESASQALREQRLYAPAGENAMEFYLALRDKQPADPAVSSALTDLMPYALIATEQSIGRDDYSEAKRLYALMEKTDKTAPALPRLRAAIADGQAAAAKRAETEKVDAAEAQKRQAELEKKRVADQLTQQKESAEKIRQQQEADARAAEAAQRTAAPPRPAQQPPAPVAAPAESEAAPARRTVSNELRPISTPGPNYPRDASRRQRAGTVEVEFTVDTDGSVSSARVVSASPPRVFDREALQAVNRWRFQPIGSPVTTRRTFKFDPTN